MINLSFFRSASSVECSSSIRANLLPCSDYRHTPSSKFCSFHFPIFHFTIRSMIDIVLPARCCNYLGKYFSFLEFFTLRSFHFATILLVWVIIDDEKLHDSAFSHFMIKIFPFLSFFRSLSFFSSFSTWFSFHQVFF